MPPPRGMSEALSASSYPPDALQLSFRFDSERLPGKRRPFNGEQCAMRQRRHSEPWWSFGTGGARVCVQARNDAMRAAAHGLQNCKEQQSCSLL